MAASPFLPASGRGLSPPPTPPPGLWEGGEGPVSPVTLGGGLPARRGRGPELRGPGSALEGGARPGPAPGPALPGQSRGRAAAGTGGERASRAHHAEPVAASGGRGAVGAGGEARGCISGEGAGVAEGGGTPLASPGAGLAVGRSRCPGRGGARRRRRRVAASPFSPFGSGEPWRR